MHTSTSFKRLLLRNPGSDSYFDNISRSQRNDATYLRDPWLLETQRALGGFTVRRRWVHLHLNGLYWGVYDLEEHPGRETIYHHLVATEPAVASLAPGAERILFLHYDGTDPATSLAAADPAAQDSWEAVIAASSAARQSPTDTGLYQLVANQLGIPDYISYMLALAVTGKDDLGWNEFRGWRHPISQKWHLMARDGDAAYFMDGFVGGTIFLNNLDKVNHFTPLPPGEDPVEIIPDQHPHEHLKFHPQSRAAFDARLQALLRASSANPNGPWPLTQEGLLARFDAHAGEFRRTFECEKQLELQRHGSKGTVEEDAKRETAEISA